jgi:hypothetical protein
MKKNIDGLARVRAELLTYLGPTPNKKNLHLSVGKMLKWIAPLLDDGHADKAIETLGENYREHGLRAYEDAVALSTSTETLRRALTLAIAELDRMERGEI